MIITKFKKEYAKDVSQIIINAINLYAKYYSKEIIKDFLDNSSVENINKRSIDREYFIAKANSEIIGIIGLKGDFLKTFYVKYPGKGIGGKLLSYIENILKENNKKELFVFALPHALEIYEKLGFKIINEKYDFTDLNNLKYKVYFMKKDIL